jgi:hypothetical protein
MVKLTKRMASVLSLACRFGAANGAWALDF